MRNHDLTEMEKAYFLERDKVYFIASEKQAMAKVTSFL